MLLLKSSVHLHLCLPALKYSHNPLEVSGICESSEIHAIMIISSLIFFNEMSS